MKHHVLAALSAAALSCLLSVRAEGASGATDFAECLRFEKTQVGKSIDLEAKSSCEAKLECKLSYSVRCENREGGTTSESQHSARFTVASGERETVSLSAESCVQGWTIENVNWSCQQGK